MGNENDTIRDFVHKCVLPDTAGEGMGLSLMLNRTNPKAVNVMVSHAWDEHAGRFFADIDRKSTPEDVFFICFFAIYQNEDGVGPTIAEQLGVDVVCGPFAQVIDKLRPGICGRPSGKMVVITNKECALYTRMWCVWEMYVALIRVCQSKSYIQENSSHMIHPL